MDGRIKLISGKLGIDAATANAATSKLMALSEFSQGNGESSVGLVYLGRLAEQSNRASQDSLPTTYLPKLT